MKAANAACVRAFPAIAALCLVLSSGGSALSQETPTQPEAEGPFTEISGFRGLDWGVPETEAISRLGEPVERRQLESGLEMIAYRGSLAGRPSVVLYGFLDEHGFLKAQEISNLAPDEECIEQVRAIHREINLRYPLITPSEQAKNNTPDAICEAAPAGEAFWHRQWRDESTGSVVTVSVRSGSDKVELTYESRTFIDWIEAEQGQTTPSVEDEGAPAEVLEAKP